MARSSRRAGDCGSFEGRLEASSECVRRSKRPSYAARRRRGLCAHCPAPALEGRSMCAAHLAARRVDEAATYAANAAAGVCVQCRQEPAKLGRRRCWRCLLEHTQKKREARR